jgi:CRP/FNR family cyclic AMP-dependent transcriptional regulator
LKTELLRSIPYFASLDEDTLASVAETAVHRAYEPDEIIFLEGEPCAGLFCVQSGHVKIYKSSPEGREQILHICRPRESFNDVAVFDGGPNPASAQAMDTTTVCLIERSAMLNLFDRHPKLAQAVVAVLAARARMLVAMVEDLSLRSVTGRLAKLLLDQATHGGEAIPLTHQQMAARLGTVREMVSRALRELEAEGLVRRAGRQIVIVDRAALERRSGQWRSEVGSQKSEVRGQR